MSALTANQAAKGKRLLDSGATWTDVARALGVSIHAVQMALKPGYREHRRATERARYRVRPPSTDIHSHGPRPVTPDEALRAIAAVPVDTRGLTARLLGDPLPGRSALERSSP